MRWLDIPPLWLLLFLALARSSRALMPGFGPPGLSWRLLGAAIILAGLVLMALAARELVRRRTSPLPHQSPKALVTTGPFAWSRNPIYLGDAVALTGAILWWGVWPALILVPGFMALITHRFVLPEEARLARAFGADFTLWASRVRRWL